MLFRQLEYFVALAREQHFARAAAACYVSQPALSEAIRKLEQELDVPLVRRGRAFEGLTPEGERVVLWARRILADQDALRDEVAALHTGLSGQLRLGLVPAGDTTSALLIEPFCSMHPLVRVRVDAGLSSPEIGRRLRRFELDAGITYLAGEDTSGLTVTPLYEERMMLVAAPELLPSRREGLTWAEVIQLQLCLLQPSMRGRQLVDRVLAEQDLYADPQIETDSIAALYAHVCTGRWASLVPHPWGYAFRLPPGLRVIPIVGPVVSSPIALLTPSGEPASVLGRALAGIAATLRFEELFGSAEPGHS